MKVQSQKIKITEKAKISSPAQGEVPAGGRGPRLHNKLKLKNHRKNLRKNSTSAEAILWKLLQGKKLAGRKFRRQHSVGPYILDFYCSTERLALELDGQGHFEAGSVGYDLERDRFLQSLGIKVLRFENQWLWEDPEGLLDAIRREFGG